MGRVRRLGNLLNIIYIHEYYLKKFFNNRFNKLNIQKILTNDIAEIPDFIISGGDKNAKKKIPQNDENIINVEKFVLFYGEIYYKNNTAVAYLRLLIFTPEKILRHIINLNKNIYI